MEWNSPCTIFFMDRRELLAESVLDKFLRYARIDTASDPRGTTVPTTTGQWNLLNLLRDELIAMQVEDVVLNPHGVLTATLPACGEVGSLAPTVGFIAHVDTSPSVSGHGVCPIIHRAYDGGPIHLPSGLVMEPLEHPDLVDAKGLDIVTSDGTTLLGADDKAGVSEIMTALSRMIAADGLHARIRVAFTPDEEIGRGVDYLDGPAFGADLAYTVDGSALGELSVENFHAENLRVLIRGHNVHPGFARGRMVNAVTLAASLIASVPAGMRPETTDGRTGYIHIDAVHANVEQAELVVLLRDFERTGLERKRRWLEQTVRTLETGHPGCTVEVERTGGYSNMSEHLTDRPEVVRLAQQAMEDCGVKVHRTAIRGGTDGARLTERGLPTPNLFAGGMEFHSRTEWVPVQWMEKAVETLVRLAELWGRV